MRDPKIDPQPGDRLRKGKRVRLVVRSDGFSVRYVWEGSSSIPRTERVCWIEADVPAWEPPPTVEGEVS